MAKKKKERTHYLRVLKQDEITKFTKEATKLKKQIKAHMTEGERLLNDAIEQSDLETFATITNILYFEGPRSETALGRLEGFFKGYEAE